MQKLSKIVKTFLKENDQPPSNWQSGFKQSKDDDFDSPLRLMRGENPFRIGEKWYLYIWDEQINDIAVFDFSSDLVIPYQDFQRKIGMIPENKKVSIEGLTSILLEEMERDDLGRSVHPDISYNTTEKKGVIDKVVATLKGKKSEQFTKAANDLLEIERLKEQLKQKEEELKNHRLRDQIYELFGAGSTLWTKTLKTVGAWEIMLAKESADSMSTEWKSVAQGLLALQPNLKEAYESLLAQHSKLRASSPARLSVKKLDEGVKSFVTKWVNKFKQWSRKYDSKLNNLISRAKSL
jgi:hypothetical protein